MNSSGNEYDVEEPNTSQNKRRRMNRQAKQQRQQRQSLSIATGKWKLRNEADETPQRKRFAPNRDEGFQLPQNGQSWSPGCLFLLFISMKSISYHRIAIVLVLTFEDNRFSRPHNCYCLEQISVGLRKSFM